MTLPADLLNAISAPAGGKVSIVMGAGCSFEPPTGLPLAGKCSEEIHARLVADGVLVAGECTKPWDLSCLADIVFAKTKSQKAIVERMLNAHAFKTAKPNSGYQIAAALLLEGKVTSVITLNFDLAMTGALVELGAGPDIAVIDGPHELGNQSSRNVYYLHRNANAVSAEDWVLRTEIIEHSWKSDWQQPITTRALTVPVIVFAGLGSPAAVLLTSTTLIRGSTPGTAKSFQVDPTDPTKCEFFKALKLPDDCFIKLGWCAFMEELGSRLVEQHVTSLGAAVAQRVAEDALSTEDLSAIIAWLKRIGLVDLGRLRALLLLRDRVYEPDTELGRPLVADLLHTLGTIERLSGAQARLSTDGVVEFVRAGRVVSAFVVVSGCGSRGRVAMETLVKRRMHDLRARPVVPQGALIGGSPGWGDPISPPVDIAIDDPAASIVTSASNPLLVTVGEVRTTPARVSEVAP